VIAVIDYDIGNLGAVANMFARLGVNCAITSDASLVAQATGIVLPGNGSFDACMRNFNESGLRTVVEQRVQEAAIPLLGICVGAQMLGHGSEEGTSPGLGWIDMKVRRFPQLEGLRIPHMGWGEVRAARPDDALCRSLDPKARFYFVHSYYLDPADQSDVLLHAHYGIDFAAGVARGNIWGVQFHPEKSHRFGKQLLGAFAELC
jgi:glutamine amidotransferase